MRREHMSSRWDRGRIGVLSAVLAGSIALVVGCGGLSSSGPAAQRGSLTDEADLTGAAYTVGGKDFDEQRVLCQITVAALESVGAKVTDRCGLGGTEVNRNALLGA